MSIFIPVALSGLAAIIALDTKPTPIHPAAAYAQTVTDSFAFRASKVKLSCAFDEYASRLTVTGQLSQVIPLRKIKLVAETLNAAFLEAVADSVDIDGLKAMGVTVTFELVDRNRTPIKV